MSVIACSQQVSWRGDFFALTDYFRFARHSGNNRDLYSIT
jgi:hypothetical protein